MDPRAGTAGSAGAARRDTGVAQITQVTATGQGLELTVNAGSNQGVAVGWVVEWAPWKGTLFTIDWVTADASRFSMAKWIGTQEIMRGKRRVRLRPP
jgi:hypothetical protein